MSLNGKRDHFELADLVAFGGFCGMKPARARELIAEVHAQVAKWMAFADEAGVPETRAAEIARAMRVGLAGSLETR
jgi:serine/threonine-protein kinase HipA